MSVSCQKNLTITVVQPDFGITLAADKATARQGEKITMTIQTGSGYLGFDSFPLYIQGHEGETDQQWAVTTDGSGHAVVEVWSKYGATSTFYVHGFPSDSNLVTITITDSTGLYTDGSGVVAWMYAWNTGEGHGGTEFSQYQGFGGPSGFANHQAQAGVWATWWQQVDIGTNPLFNRMQIGSDDPAELNFNHAYLHAVVYVGGVEVLVKWNKTNAAFGFFYPAGVYAISVDPTGSAPATVTINDQP